MNGLFYAEPVYEIHEFDEYEIHDSTTYKIAQFYLNLEFYILNAFYWAQQLNLESDTYL